MLCIVLVYLMLHAVSSNAVCLYNASVSMVFLPLIFGNAFSFHA